jgi:hypothetical protein
MMTFAARDRRRRMVRRAGTSSARKRRVTIITRATPNINRSCQALGAPSRNPRGLLMSAEGEGPRVICEFSNYDELINGLRLRVAELNLSGQELDSVSNLPERYSQKILGPSAIRSLGRTSLGPFLAAVAVRGVLVEDKAAVERLRRRTTPRKTQYVRTGTVHIELSRRHMSKIAAQGGRNSRKFLGKRLVKQLARRAAAARWEKGPPATPILDHVMIGHIIECGCACSIGISTMTV